MPAAVVVLLLSFCAMVAALYQHFVASKSNLCALTLADPIFSSLQLDRLAPSWFEPTANCADAVVAVLGIGFDVWSLMLYCAVAVSAALAIRAR